MSPGAKSGMSSRSWARSTRSVAVHGAALLGGVGRETGGRGCPRCYRSRRSLVRELVEQPPRSSCGQGPGRRAGRAGARASGAAPAARRHRAIRAWSPERSTSGTAQPRNSAGRVYCGYSSSPSANDSSARRLLVAHHAGHEPGDRLDDHERGRLAAREHVVADRELAVAEVVGDTLVDALVAPAQQREARRPRRARSAIALVEARARAADRSSSGRGGSTASTAANSGSGVITMPAPPPNGASSTVRCAVGGVLTRDRGRARRQTRARAPGRAATRSQRTLEVLGEDREHVDAHRGSQLRLTSRSPSGGSTITTPGSLLDDEHERDERAVVEHEQVVRRVGLDRGDTAEHVPAHVAHLRADQLVHPDPSCRPDRRGARRRASRRAAASARVAIVEPSKRTSQRPWCGRALATISVRSTGAAGRRRGRCARGGRCAASRRPRPGGRADRATRPSSRSAAAERPVTPRRRRWP